MTRFPVEKSGAAWIGGGERSEPVSRMVILPYDTEGKSRNVLASPLGEEGHEVAEGVQANWIHRGAPRPANPVRRHPAKSVCTRVRMIMILDVDVTAERRHYNTHRPLKGKRLTTFCASLVLLQIMFAVHRFARGAADWRSGPRWSIISVLCLVHPFPLRGTSPQGETRK